MPKVTWKSGDNAEVAKQYDYTPGKVYVATEFSEQSFELVNDLGVLHKFYRGRFDIVPEQAAVPAPRMLLSEDPAVRKATPICTGVLDYFPLALAAVAQCSKVGNDQHNPGQALHWAKEKSTDHVDCIVRHLIDRDTVDTDGIAHAAKLAWRALAFLQIKLEQEAAK